MTQTEAMLNEIAYQRMILGDRCANFAGQLAAVTAERDALKKELEEAKKKLEAEG